MWVINPTVGCHYFPPGPQLPSQPLRELLSILLLGDQRHNECVNSLPKTVTRQRRGCDLNPGPSAPESSTLTTRLPSHPICRRPKIPPRFYILSWRISFQSAVVNLHSEAEIRNHFSFVCISFNTWQKLVSFFIYSKQHISYTSVYLILACVKNFA